MAGPFDGIVEKIQGLAGEAAKDEHAEPGPGDAGPSLQTKTSDLVTLTMQPAQIDMWFEQIKRSTDRRAEYSKEWDILLKEYLPIVSASGTPESVKLMTHFRNVHTKMGQLFYRSPELILMPKGGPSPADDQQPNPMEQQLRQVVPNMPPMPPVTREDIIAVKQALLNQKMGRDGLKAERLMDLLLFDVLAWAGIGCSKLGYSCYKKAVQQPQMGPPQMPTMPSNPLGLQAPPTDQTMMVPQFGPDGAPLMTTQMLPVYEDYFWRRFSPKKLLLPYDLRSTMYDADAIWQGMDFFMTPERAMLSPEQGGLALTEAEASKGAEDTLLYLYDKDKPGGGLKGLIHCYELWIRSAYCTGEVHPLALTQLILVENVKRPIVYRPSPDQSFDPRTGRLTEDSMIGNPIRVLTIRDLADSCYPSADSAFTNSGVKQMTTYRRQGVALRDAAIGKYLADAEAFEDDGDKDKAKNGEVGEFIFIKPGLLGQRGREGVLTTTAQVEGTRTDARTEEALKQDNDETLGVSSWSAGAPQDTVRTATEVASVTTAIASRNEKEQSRVIDFYLDGARMLDQLLMRYAEDIDYITIAGEDGAQRNFLWNKVNIAGKYYYDIAPDSQLKIDTPQTFDRMARLYNLAARDPLFNRAYVLRRIARSQGLDPAKIVLQPAQMIQQPQHAGAGGEGDMVNKHVDSNSGKRPNEPGAENHRDNQP